MSESSASIDNGSLIMPFAIDHRNARAGWSLRRILKSNYAEKKREHRAQRESSKLN
jgi:hypothetical protein